MGFFLVFFPEEQQQQPFNSPTLKRTNSNPISTKTQSTISVCALLIFVTLLVFTLSSFEPHNDFISSHRNLRLHLQSSSNSNLPALNRLGTLYTRGTTAMNELVICHVSELVTSDELKLFLRTFHWSGLGSKSDLLFVFDSISTIESFDDVIREENEVFLKLVHRFESELGNETKAGGFPASFDPTRFVKPGKNAEKGEPIWGRRGNGGNSSGTESTRNVTRSATESTRLGTELSYGSVVGFGVGELDPENSLSGFLDHVPLGLRRWASYPMILGRVRRKFKKIMLVDVKEVLLLGDPLGRVKSYTSESIFISSTPQQKHGRKAHKPVNSVKSVKGDRKIVNPSLILGGERGVRRLSAAMLTEIVRSTSHQRHKPHSLTVSTLLSQLAANEFLQKTIRFIQTESIPEPGSLTGVELANLTVVRRGNSNFDIGEIFLKHICSFPIESSVYTEC